MQDIWAVLDWLLKFTLVLHLVLKSQGIISKVTHLVKNLKSSFCFSETFAFFWVGEQTVGPKIEGMQFSALSL